MLGEGDRRESARRVDAYLVEERDAAAITYATYTAAAATGRAALVVFFKRAHRLGLIVGASIKSDLGLGNRRTTSGELHLDRCPLVFFALPRVNERAGAMSDVLVRVNVRPRFTVSGSGRVRYLGAQPPKGVVVAVAAPGTAACSAASAAASSVAVGRHTLSSVAEVRWARHAHAAHAAHAVHAVHAVHARMRRFAPVALCCVVGRESLATIKTKMDAEGWHEVLLLSMGARAAPEEDDWPRRGTKRARPATPEPNANATLGAAGTSADHRP